MSARSEPAGAVAVTSGCRAWTLVILLATGGCATVSEPLRGNLSFPATPVGACASWFQGLDEAVDQAGVRDAGAYRVPGYPYLRVNRFLASFRERVLTDEATFDAWLRHARAMDREARVHETRNLPAARLEALGVPAPEQAVVRSDECAAVLSRNDLASASARAALAERAQVPDDYSDWLRAVGLYGLSRIPFTGGVERWHAEAVEMFRQSREGVGPARAFQRYAPRAPAPVARGTVREILARSSRDRLGIPRIAAADLDRLFEAFAPVYEIETTGDYDRFGTLAWTDAPAPAVDLSMPTVYRRLAWTRYQDSVLPQLVYTIWFPERPRDGPFDMLGGRLDGIVLRVTLLPDGAAWVYDSIHPCGCYHMFFPTPLAEAKPAPVPGEEWAFIPARLPALADGQRVVVRIASRTHYLVDIAADTGAVPARAYDWLEEDSLRSLPAGEGARRSLYGPDGLVRGTERGERLLFWPMGIASSGAMRQWGRHATAFVGRRHFDDADLIERRFERVAH
jgi:hypothetical protein